MLKSPSGAMPSRVEVHQPVVADERDELRGAAGDELGRCYERRRPWASCRSWRTRAERWARGQAADRGRKPPTDVSFLTPAAMNCP
jgi:hypothetical protein